MTAGTITKEIDDMSQNNVLTLKVLMPEYLPTDSPDYIDSGDIDFIIVVTKGGESVQAEIVD
tara:strand:+ start:942 stop:1127 length:186 start_codon:yes stop_codon:yes gene_type:complete